MMSQRHVWLLALVLAGCAADQESEPGVATAGVVRGTITYAGPLRGPLVVAIFPSFPPRGAPIAQQRIESPRFPQPYEIQGVPAGAWYVLAIVDTDLSDGQRFHPSRDPGGAFGAEQAPWSLRLEPAGGAQDIDISLIDPAATSPWMRSNYR